MELKINFPNILTFLRIFLSPFFLLMIFLINQTESANFIYFVILWLIYFIIEISDLLDGLWARKFRQVTDFGKLLDPFADSISRLTAFLGFTWIGIMPFLSFIIILYRELTISFLRTLFMQKGIVQGARITGKIKAIFYAVANISALITLTLKKHLILDDLFAIFKTLSICLFYLAALSALISVINYFYFYLVRKNKNS